MGAVLIAVPRTGRSGGPERACAVGPNTVLAGGSGVVGPSTEVAGS
jgi:hypothetical protein